MSIKKIVVYAFIFLLLGLAYLFLIGALGNSKSNDLSSRSVDQGEKLMVGETIAIITHPEIAKINSPLPPIGVQVASIYDGLKQRADAGNTKAACRLAIDLSKCSQNKKVLESLSLGSATDADFNASESQQMDDEFKLSALQTEKLCQGMTIAQLKERGKYLRQAAHAGIPVAMVNYANGAGFENDMSLLQDPLFDLWKKDAVNMTERALSMGMPEAVAMLASAYASDSGRLGGLIPDDPVKAEVYRLLGMRLLNVSIEPNNSLPKKDIDYAIAESNRMFAQYFQNQPTKQKVSLLVYLEANNIPDDMQKSACE
jgi:hypothetical protein